jgi:hypothetical protein
MKISFDRLPDDARLWVFATSRALTALERDELFAEVDGFLEHWTAHGAPVVASRDWRDDRFLLIGVDERATGLSGCSIDALIRSLATLEHRIGAAVVGTPPIWYREGREITTASREGFETLATDGSVGPDTTVFDNTLASVGELRAGRFEIPARESWHGVAFFQESGT